MMHVNGGISADMAQELQSWSRMIHAAAADKKAVVLTNAMCEAGRHIAAGRLEKIGTCDWFYKEGKTAGLCDDAIQLALVAGLNQPVSPKGEPQWKAGLDTVCVADVQARPIEWLWTNRVALGKNTVLAGDGGLGKSAILCDLAARTTTGARWPDGAANGVSGNVIILAAEDALDDTIKPRLHAAGADLSKVFCITATREETKDSRRSFNLQADLKILKSEIERIGNVRLVEIDPVSSYLGKLDSHKNDQVRAVLDPLGQLATRTRAAIVCNNHFSKGGGNANSRIIGSVAFVNQARAAFVVSQDPDDATRRLFMPSKMNVAALGEGLGYRIGGIELELDGVNVLTVQVCWDLEPVTMSADAVLARLSERDQGKSAIEEAGEFLKDILKAGPLAANDVKAQASNAGLSWATVRRAKDGLVVVNADGGPGVKDRWKWSLDAKTLKEFKDAHVSDVSTLTEDEHLTPLANFHRQEK